jgi:tetratricopeptide (TPR) repeat protein
MRQQVAQLQQTAISEFVNAEKAAGAKEPNLHLVLANLGAAYESAGNYEQAAASFQRAIALKPDQANYNVGLANSLSRLGRVEEATAACERIGALDPANAATCFRNIGIVLYNASKLKEAVVPLRKATEIDPKHADAWYLLGASLLASMESKQVGDKLEFVVQPGTAEAYSTYLELAPNGRFAAEAKAALQSLEALGAGVATKVKAGKKKN